MCDILNKNTLQKEVQWMMIHNTREEELAFLKRLWQELPTLCPCCGKSELTYLHKKAKKSNNDWKCPACGEIFRTINMMMDLPEK